MRTRHGRLRTALYVTGALTSDAQGNYADALAGPLLQRFPVPVLMDLGS